MSVHFGVKPEYSGGLATWKRHASSTDTGQGLATKHICLKLVAVIPQSKNLCSGPSTLGLRGIELFLPSNCPYIIPQDAVWSKAALLRYLGKGVLQIGRVLEGLSWWFHSRKHHGIRYTVSLLTPKPMLHASKKSLSKAETCVSCLSLIRLGDTMPSWHDLLTHWCNWILGLTRAGI